ncbi:MAG TPA: kelch repeat-containing protein [Thermoplasmata archaeon]|nr:kelch repeat-containing protein [Thermoplasmata archaeon]
MATARRGSGSSTSVSRRPPFRCPGATGAVLLVALSLSGIASVGISHATSPASAALSTDAVNNGVSPPPTQRAMTVYDAADGYVLMFGGLDPNLSTIGTTWTFGAGNWTNLTPSLASVPSPRWGAGIAYDVADGYVVMFGGCPDNACSSVLGDTWTFSHGKWTDLTGSLNVSPSAREGPSMTWDGALGRILLFGGGGPPGLVNDTWTFVGGAWSRVNVSASPPARDNAMLAFDPVLNESVLFGGVGSSANLGDTWTFQNRNWSAVPAGPAPSPRHAGALLWDGTDRYLLQATGYADGTYYGDTWTFGSGGWSPLTTNGAVPGPLYGANAAFDAADGYVLFFSGQVPQGTLTTTWTYADGHWAILINPPGGPGSALANLGPLILLPVLFFLIIALAVVLQRRRLRGHAEWFTVGPGAPIRWIPTPPGALSIRWSRFAAFLIVPLILVPFAFAPGGLFVVALDAIIFVPLVALLVHSQRSRQVTSVGIVREGVIFQMRSSTVRVGWAGLQPPLFLPKGRAGIFFRYSYPNENVRAGFSEVTVDQARAILSAPESPGYPLSPPVAAALGLPMLPSTPPPPPPPPPMAPRPTPPSYRTTARGTVVASSAPLPSSASPYVTCPGCGQVSMRGQWQFCQNCGRPLPRS